ncbi:MAG TPA: efflux RND transporter periplasmic adaptor subunit [Pararhizobium sp.]|jgi:RND family efflux transporter MFP subunit|nr:efflux RND transporter periplasmic adaptor subunit [Pararhizobium sp.]
MALWKQALLCLVLLAGAFVAWLHFDSGAVKRLKSYGISGPVIAAIAPSGTTADKAPSEQSENGGGVSPATLVVTKKVGDGTLNSRVKAIGSGMALHTVTLTPTDAGTIKTIEVSAGDHVEPGQVIATLDSEAQRIAAEHAKLTLSDDEKKLARYRELKTSSAVSSVEISNQETQVAADRLALKQAQYNLGKRTINAPIPGVIGIIAVNVGDYVTTETKIGTIDDRSRILVDFQVPERYLGAVKVGNEVDATASAFPGRTFKGKVSAIDNRIDPDSRTLRVRAELPNKDDLLRAGMSFLVTMHFPGDTYPSVNPLAVQWDSSGAYVWRVENNKAERVPVQIVQRNPQSVLVNGKLAKGDSVVTQGVQVLRAGSAVQVADSDQSGADASGFAPEKSETKNVDDSVRKASRTQAAL